MKTTCEPFAQLLQLKMMPKFQPARNKRLSKGQITDGAGFAVNTKTSFCS